MRVWSVLLLAGASAGAMVALAPGAASRTSERPDALRAFPLGAPHGVVELTSYGVAELQPDDEPAIAALHVRAVIANQDDVHHRSPPPWAFDASAARLSVGAWAPIRPAFVNADIATLPLAIVGSGETQMIDLYFPLPHSLPAHDGAITFAIAWPTYQPRETVRAVFAHEASAAPGQRSLEPAAGAGAHWWFDPRYAWTTYDHRPGIAVPRPPLHVTLTSAPTWDHPLVTGVPHDDLANPCNEW